MTNAKSNVTHIESKQPAATKFMITASIDGFPVSVEVEGKADNLRAMIDRLKTIGAQPVHRQKSEAAENIGFPGWPPI